MPPSGWLTCSWVSLCRLVARRDHPIRALVPVVERTALAVALQADAVVRDPDAAAPHLLEHRRCHAHDEDRDRLARADPHPLQVLQEVRRVASGPALMEGHQLEGSRGLVAEQQRPVLEAVAVEVSLAREGRALPNALGAQEDLYVLGGIRGAEELQIGEPLPQQRCQARAHTPRWCLDAHPARSIARSAGPSRHLRGKSDRGPEEPPSYTTLLGVLECDNAGCRKLPRQTHYGLARTKTARRCPSRGQRMVAHFHVAWVRQGP